MHPNAPWALSAHPSQFVVPANATDIHSSRWVCYECVRPLDDIMDDPRFENKEGMPEAALGKGGEKAKMLAHGSPYDKQREGVRLWEIRDKKTGLVGIH